MCPRGQKSPNVAKPLKLKTGYKMQKYKAKLKNKETTNQTKRLNMFLVFEVKGRKNFAF